MTAKVSAAPSWQETTLQWIKENCPHYLGARGGPAQKLTAALRKASYLLQEAAHDRAAHELLLAACVGKWDLRSHNQFREWIEEGGYVAPAHIPAPAGAIPPVIVQTSNGPEAIHLEPGDEEMLEKLTPPAEHMQTLEEALAEEELRRDDRYGAW